eukprot:2031215-Prymnesium_polylepis.1
MAILARGSDTDGTFPDSGDEAGAAYLAPPATSLGRLLSVALPRQPRDLRRLSCGSSDAGLRGPR